MRGNVTLIRRRKRVGSTAAGVRIGKRAQGLPGEQKKMFETLQAAQFHSNFR